jgi:uncharacterized protein (TIGR03067 family)
VQITADKLSPVSNCCPGSSTSSTSFDIKLDPSTSPKNIDLTLSGGDKVLRGIYKLEDNVLSIAVSCTDDRPTTFDNRTKQVLLVLKQ